MVEQKINWLCIGFFSYSQFGKIGFANLYYKGFKIIFRTEILQLLALNIAQLNMWSSRSKCGMGTLSSSNSTKHHDKRFSNHTLMFIYQESKINKQANKVKHHTRHKIYKDFFIWFSLTQH
jgi:hypothetical protein